MPAFGGGVSVVGAWRQLNMDEGMNWFLPINNDRCRGWDAQYQTSLLAKGVLCRNIQLYLNDRNWIRIWCLYVAYERVADTVESRAEWWAIVCVWLVFWWRSVGFGNGRWCLCLHHLVLWMLIAGWLPVRIGRCHGVLDRPKLTIFRAESVILHLRAKEETASKICKNVHPRCIRFFYGIFRVIFVYCHPTAAEYTKIARKIPPSTSEVTSNTIARNRHVTR